LPNAAQLAASPIRAVDQPTAAWPRSAQIATAFLLLLLLALLGWHVLSSQRLAGRPTSLEPGALPAYRLDLNRAGHAELLQLPGVGENLARRIEAYRQDHNGFRDVNELRKVGGIGPALMERLRPFVFVNPPDGEEESEQPEPDSVPPRKSVAAVSVAIKKDNNLTGRIDVNRASAEELRKLPGVGPKTSESIIETRRKEPFKSVDDLRRVPGIGPKKLEQLRPLVTVGDEPKREAAGDGQAVKAGGT
jgi:competence ComEA-like helix-hairpin-helix protein